jgi:hypothetical protein
MAWLADIAAYLRTSDPIEIGAGALLESSGHQRGQGPLFVAVEGGVRVFWIAAATMQALVDRLALVLDEHMTADDELHVTYNAMQSGWQHHPARLMQKEWTELHFEYSAFVVLRQHDEPAAKS